MEAHPRTWVGVSVDIKNAFSSVDHKAVETALIKAGGNMKLALGFFRQMYSATQPPSVLIPPQQEHPPTVLKMDEKRGVMQGCGMSMIFFCAALHRPIDHAARAADTEHPTTQGDGFRNGMAPTYADDIQAYGTPEWIDVYYATLRKGLTEAKLEVSPEKSKLFDFRQGDALADEEMNDKVDSLQHKLNMPKVDQLIALGVPFGSTDFVQQQLEERATAIGTYCDKIGCLPDVEVALRLLTKSAAAKSSYHMRLLPPSITQKEATACSVHLRKTMRGLLGEGLGPGIGANTEMDDPDPLPEDADAATEAKHEAQLLRAQLLRNMLTMPTRNGGMGLSVPEGETDACFLAGRASFTEHMRCYSVPWRLAMEKHMLDKTTAEGRAIDEALEALKEQTGGGPDSPIKDVATLLQTEKTTPSALLSGAKQALLDRVLESCSDPRLGDRRSNIKAALLSNSNKWATFIYNAPLTPKPWCTAKQFVTVLRLRLGLTNMGLPLDHRCECGATIDTYHALTCRFSKLYYRRHNAIVLACAKMYRTAGSTIVIEPMLKEHVKSDNKRRLDIAATYGGKRYLVDISVSATQIKKVGTTVTGKVEAGMAANVRYKEKVVKYGAEVKKLGDILQVVAFDTAGCPALLTCKELDAWIAYARELEGEDTSGGPPSFTEMRARIVRELVKAQASSLLRISHRAIS